MNENIKYYKGYFKGEESGTIICKIMYLDRIKGD